MIYIYMKSIETPYLGMNIHSQSASLTFTIGCQGQLTHSQMSLSLLRLEINYNKCSIVIN